MAVELGGRASKLGDTYERLWAVRCALMIIEGRYQSLLWEPIGDDEKGIDLWVTANDGHRIGHQFKRQNRSREYWSVADLRSVLQDAKLQLGRDSRAEYVFVSSCGVKHLRGLAERSRRHSTGADRFVEEHVCTEKNRRREFAALLSAWDLDERTPEDVETAFALLRRMTFHVFDRTKYTRLDVEHVAGLQIDGDSATVVATIGDHLDNNLGHEFHADELRAYLRDKEFRFRRLAGDASIPPAIERLQGRFEHAIAPGLIAGRSIDRPESTQIAEAILGDLPPRIVLVHGGAGAGKSVVLDQVRVKLKSHNTPVLPVQLHAYRPEGTPDSFGRTKCDLPASPAITLRALAGERRAVVILDQMDSLRMTSAHSHESWAAFRELVADVLADHATTVVVACRSFDLENDPNISAWRQQVERRDNEALVVRIGELPDEEVTKVLEPLGFVFSNLTARQKALLKQPGNLALWWSLAQSGRLPPSLDNATQLMRLFIKMRRDEAVRDHGALPADIGNVLSTLVRYLDARGRLDAPAALVQDYTIVVDSLCSVGLLARDNGVLTFAHQSYFDHMVAERVLAEAVQGGQDPVDWVRANQSLFRRDQLRQLLTLLRECDEARYAALLKSILLDEGIRFHLKHLVLGLLRQADPVLDHEAELVMELCRDPAWWEHALSSIFWARPPWFDALDRVGAIAEWLSDTGGGQRIRQVLRFLRSVADVRGERIDDLLAPYWTASGEWTDHLLETLAFNPCNDTPQMAALRLDMVRSGEIMFNDMFMDVLAKRSPERLVRLVAAAVSVWIEKTRKHLRAPDDQDAPDWHFHDQCLNAVVLDAVRGTAHSGWELFAESLCTIARLHRAIKRRLCARGDSHSINWGALHLLAKARDFVESLLIASVEGMAQASPEHVTHVLNSLSHNERLTLERAITKGLAAGTSALANRAIQWLCDRPARFRLGDGRDEIYWEPARALIEHFAPHCSEAMFVRLQAAILAHHDEWERRSFERQHQELKNGCLVGNDWGRAQNVLLAALPEDRMSPEARSAAATWRRKFGDPTSERPTGALVSSGWITSPIPPNKLLHVSDREWLRIISAEWPEHEGRRWRQHGPSVVGEASLRQFADALGAAAQQNPKRFVALALRLPVDSSPAYFTALLHGLTATNPPQGREGWEPATVAELEAIMDHVGDCADEAYIRTACQAVQERDDGRWSDHTIERVISYAEHPHPSPGEFTVGSYAGKDGGAESDVGGTAINCVRGAAAGAIIALFRERPDAYDRLLPAAERLLVDPHPSVRHEALGACLPIWNHDKDMAVRLLIAACEHEDDRVLGSHWLNRLVGLARATHLEQLKPVIQRMALSRENDVAESGAAWATACWLDGDHFAELVEACRSGSTPQRSGVTEAALQYFSQGITVDRSGPVLGGMFRDADRDVRLRAAGVFRHKDVFTITESVTLATEFIRSPAFNDDPGYLLRPLSEYGGDIAHYSQVILDAADAVAGPLAEGTRDIRQRNAFAGNEVSALLFRLYERAYGTRDQELQDQYLDRWDAMLKNRVGMTDDHLRLLDD